MTQERLLTVDETAEQLRLSPYTVRLWLRQGRIRGFRMGSSRAGWRVPESEIRRLIEEMQRGEFED